jgi:serine/threonine protein kinase
VNTASHPSLRNPPDLPVLGADRFEIQERIGAGGMGTVYKAVQKSVGRSVAVKVLSSEYASNAAGVARFVREATVVSRLVHPNIVSMIEFGRDPEGNLLLVMELLEGEPLRQTLRRERRLPPWRAVQIAMQVLAALRVAHAAGVVHRDLKPENIFITNVDGADHAKVLDFGVAKMLQHEVGHETTAGSLVGTLKYMAPEQIAGDPPDARVDLYALGVLLYEMLGGALPYEHKERVALLRAILNDPPVPLSNRGPDLPQGLCDLVMRAISKLTIDRVQSADEFRSLLAPFAMAGPDARPPSFPITQEIRLPIAKAPSSDRESSTRAGTPNAISSATGRPSIPSGVSGVKSPTDPGLVLSSSAALVSSDVMVPSSIPAPPTYPPYAAHDANNYTTGAGLSAATHRSQAIAQKKTASVFVVIGGVLIAVAAASVGIVAARGSKRAAPRRYGLEQRRVCHQRCRPISRRKSRDGPHHASRRRGARHGLGRSALFADPVHGARHRRPNATRADDLGRDLDRSGARRDGRDDERSARRRGADRARACGQRSAANAGPRGGRWRAQAHQHATPDSSAQQQQPQQRLDIPMFGSRPGG